MFSHSGSQVKNMDILSNVGRILLSKELSGELPTRLKTDNPGPKDFEETPGDAVEILTDSTPEKKANKGTTTSCFRREQACEIVEKVLRNESLTFAVCFIGGPERANFNVYDPQQYLEGSLVPETLFCATDEYSTDFFDGIVGRVSPWIQGNKLKPGVEGNDVFFGQTKFIPRTIGRAAYIKLMQKCLSEELRFADAVGMKAVMMEGREYKALETTNLVSVLNSAQFQDFRPQIWMVYPLVLSEPSFWEADRDYSDEITLTDWGKLRAKVKKSWKLQVCLKINLEKTQDADEKVLRRWLTEPIAAVWLSSDIFYRFGVKKTLRESKFPAVRKFLRVLFTRHPGCKLILDSECAYPTVLSTVKTPESETVETLEPEKVEKSEAEKVEKAGTEKVEAREPGGAGQREHKKAQQPVRIQNSVNGFPISISDGSVLNHVGSNTENDQFVDVASGDMEICAGLLNGEIHENWREDFSRYSNLGCKPQGSPEKESGSRNSSFRGSEYMYKSAVDLTETNDVRKSSFGAGGFLGARSMPNSPAKPGFGSEKRGLRGFGSQDLVSFSKNKAAREVLVLSTKKLTKMRGISQESLVLNHFGEKSPAGKGWIEMREKTGGWKKLDFQDLLAPNGLDKRDSGFCSDGTSSRSSALHSPELEQNTAEFFPDQGPQGKESVANLRKVILLDYLWPHGKSWTRAIGWPELDIKPTEEDQSLSKTDKQDLEITEKTWVPLNSEYCIDECNVGRPNFYAYALEKHITNTIAWEAQYTDFERSVTLKTVPTIFRGFEGRCRPGNTPDLEVLYSEYGAAFQLAVSQLYKKRYEFDCWLKKPDEKLVVALLGVTGCGELVEVLVDVANKMNLPVQINLYPLEADESFIPILEQKFLDDTTHMLHVGPHVTLHVESSSTRESICDGIVPWKVTSHVDILLCDLLGECGQTEWAPEVLRSVQVWLKKDAVVIPDRYSVMVAPVAAPKLTNVLTQIDHVNPFERPQIVLNGTGVLFPLAEGKPFMTYELTPYGPRGPRIPDGSDKTQTISEELTWEARQNGILGGYVAYLELEMTMNGRKITSLPGEKQDAIYLRSFRPTFFPADPREDIYSLKHKPCLVIKGTEMGVKLNLKKSFQKGSFKMWYEWEPIVKDQEVWPLMQNKDGASHSVEFKKVD